LKTVVVIGASKGIGAAVSQHYSEIGYEVYAISRTKPDFGIWVKADISNADGISEVINSIGERTIDALLFMGGTWEDKAFTDAFDFRKTHDYETRNIIAVNLIAPIEITKGLAKNLAASSNPRAIFIGALSGLDQLATKEVANTASKFGLRGAIQALRKTFIKENIGFTVVNPGNIATKEVLDDIKAGRFETQIPIPIDDLISALDWILSLSSSVETSDINLLQKSG